MSRQHVEELESRIADEKPILDKLERSFSSVIVGQD